MITWYRKNQWDNLTFRVHRYNKGLWLQKSLIGCDKPMMKCSYVCRAVKIPQSSRCKVDIFCTSSVNTLELKETVRFPFGNSCTRLDPVPIPEEQTWIWNGYFGFGFARNFFSLILTLMLWINFSCSFVHSNGTSSLRSLQKGFESTRKFLMNVL